MALYSVYEPEEPPADLVERADSLVFVKDGFCWPAFFVAPFWLLYHRVWVGLGLFIGGFVLLDVLLSLSKAGEAISGWAVLGYMFFFAMEANGLRRHSLECKGYEQIGMAVGSRDEAEIRFFAEWLPGQQAMGPNLKTGKTASAKAAAAKMSAKTQSPTSAAPSRSSDDGIIGSFPNA
ncbi:DUF2628 domain-containing protein [Methyloligella solikamskensis]|uniref:DUF2628 domain-containing protein n=1 Tax=Methyloligella solikamskensis TaxID=1177756 RepID=A0ABW3J7F1_9HYPH